MTIVHTTMISHFLVTSEEGQRNAAQKISTANAEGWTIAGMSTCVDTAACICLTVVFTKVG